MAASVRAAAGRLARVGRSLRLRRGNWGGGSSRLGGSGSLLRGSASGRGVAVSGSSLRSSGSTREDLGTGTLGKVGLVAAPDAEGDLRVVLLVDTGNLDTSGGSSALTARDGNLSAAVVELGLTTVSTVETCLVISSLF